MPSGHVSLRSGTGKARQRNDQVLFSGPGEHGAQILTSPVRRPSRIASLLLQRLLVNLIEELPDIAANLAALDVADATSDGRINLTHLNGSTGFILEGIDASDYSGRSVSAAGDGNGGTDTAVLGDAAGAVK